MSDTSPPASPAKRSGGRRAPRWLPPPWQIIAWLVGLAVTLPAELRRYLPIRESGGDLAAWLVNANVDTTLPFLLLLAAPVVWLIPRLDIFRRGLSFTRSSPWLGESTRPGTDRSRETDWRDWLLASIVALISLAVSIGVSLARVQDEPPVAFGDLPPAYHDEYSYLFQAETFLKGRVSSPSHPEMPELFDQTHVLNEGRMASRYFPGTGVWMAPFVAIGAPYLGQWLAGAVCAFCIFWAGRELAGNSVGLLAGLLTAIAPGMAIFSNMLLAHHPTLAGLSLFLLMFLRLLRTKSGLEAFFAGCGLTFAMFCRPMTAAGFGLPFGVCLFGWLCRGWTMRNLSFRFTRVASLAGPVVAGLIGFFAYSYFVTGDWRVTPYEQYLNIYTPRHVYGFDNVIRGEQRVGEKVLEDYDTWAENLTPALAMRNLWERLASSWQWTLGIVPLMIAAAVFPRYAADHDRRWWLIAAAIMSLHAVHIPYWYAGIMGWHYVFETGPLWLLLFAGSTQGLIEDWRVRGRAWMPTWWAALAIVSLLPQYVAIEPLWWTSRAASQLQTISFSRSKYAAVNEAIDRYVEQRPALVLVSQSLHETHIDYVLNEPGLKEGVLRGRLHIGETDVSEVVRTFADRAVYAILAVGDDPAAVIGDAKGLAIEPVGSFALPPMDVARVYRIRAGRGN